MGTGRTTSCMPDLEVRARIASPHRRAVGAREDIDAVDPDLQPARVVGRKPCAVDDPDAAVAIGSVRSAIGIRDLEEIDVLEVGRRADGIVARHLEGHISGIALVVDRDVEVAPARGRAGMQAHIRVPAGVAGEVEVVGEIEFDVEPADVSDCDRGFVPGRLRGCCKLSAVHRGIVRPAGIGVADLEPGRSAIPVRRGAERQPPAGILGLPGSRWRDRPRRRLDARPEQRVYQHESLDG